MKRSRVIVRGAVQGVFFRASVRRLALDHGLSGWVRNLGDGSVEAVFEGSPEDVASMVEYCHTGPPGASVEAVDVADETPQDELGFAVR